MQPSPFMYPCPACGFISFRELFSEFEICSVCCWQDSYDRLAFPLDGQGQGPNYVSLVEAQRNFAKYGSIRKRLKPQKRRLHRGRDPEWFPITDDMIPHLPRRDTVPESELDKVAPTRHYYWRDNYAFKDKR